MRQPTDTEKNLFGKSVAYSVLSVVREYFGTRMTGRELPPYNELSPEVRGDLQLKVIAVLCLEALIPSAYEQLRAEDNQS